MDQRYHADVLVGIFNALGFDVQTIETENKRWAVKIMRHDGRIVRINDDSVVLYDSEDDFLSGRAADVIPLR